MLGKKIKELRISRGLTTRKFAKELGIAYGMVNRYESEATTPRPEMLERIAKLFGVTLGELTNSKPIKITGVKFDSKRFEQSLTDSRQLDEDSKTLLNLMIDELLEKKKLKEYKAKVEQLT